MSRTLRAVELAAGCAMMSVAFAGCASGPSDAAKTFCTAVEHLRAAGPDEAVAMSNGVITEGEHSGDSRLDAAGSAT